MKFPWKVTDDGIQVLKQGDKVYIYTPETDGIGMYKDMASHLYYLIKNRRKRKLLLKMLRATLEEKD